MALLIGKQAPTKIEDGVIYKPFGWISSWKTTDGSSHGEGAYIFYMQEHPEEMDAFHVLMS
jgi:hypothetical protein